MTPEQQLELEEEEMRLPPPESDYESGTASGTRIGAAGDDAFESGLDGSLVLPLLTRAGAAALLAESALVAQPASFFIIRSPLTGNLARMRPRPVSPALSTSWCKQRADRLRVDVDRRQKRPRSSCGSNLG